MGTMLKHCHESMAFLRALRRELMEEYNESNKEMSYYNSKEPQKIHNPEIKIEDLSSRIGQSYFATMDSENEVYTIHLESSNKLETINEAIKCVLEKCLRGKNRFYRFDKTECISVTIIDIAAIPSDFAYAYFGYDTGIDGLNTLLNGGLYIPFDSPAYMVIGGTSGAGKTNLCLGLVAALLNDKQTDIAQNSGDSKKQSPTINSNDTSKKYPLAVEYILIEQVAKNLERSFNDLDLFGYSVSLEKDSQDENKYSLHKSGDVEKTSIGFNCIQMPMYSISELLEHIIQCERNNENKRDKRMVYVIDSTNALLDVSVDDQEWRRTFQALKSITEQGNSIVIFVYERADDHKDSTLEYLADIVIHLFREISEGEVWRTIEVIESRFQSHQHGRHPFFIKNTNEAFSVYPLVSAMQAILPLQMAPVNPDQENKEYGIKIDGFLKYYEYCHNRKYDMEPFFLKNSISLLDGDRGCSKSAFGYLFAKSSFRDEIWIDGTKDEQEKQGEQQEVNYKVNPPNRIIQELQCLQEHNAKPLSKCIGMVLHFGEMYNEKKNDVVWDTFFGKVIIPDCKIDEKNKKFGYISIIVCFFETRDYSEAVYLSVVWEITRAIKTYQVRDDIPCDYETFIKKAKISKINNPYNIEAENSKGEEENSKKDEENSEEVEMIHPNASYHIYNDTSWLRQEMCEFSEEKSNPDNKNTKYKWDENNPENWGGYENTKVFPIYVSRLLVDNCENLVDVFQNIQAKSFISILAHFCLSDRITMMLINTIESGLNNEINQICQAIADNVFMFKKANLLGNWYSTMQITRSAKSIHNEQVHQIYKRKDGLLELIDSFSLIDYFDSQQKRMLPLRVFAPGYSKEFTDYLNEVRLRSSVSTNNSKTPDYLGENRVFVRSAVDYRFKAENLTFNNEWHDYLDDMLRASLSHIDVSVIIKKYCVSDVSIILDNESLKDAVTLMMIPGHILPRYLSNLVVLSDYINFYDKPKYSDTGDFDVHTCLLSESSEGKSHILTEFHKVDKNENQEHPDSYVFGKSYHFMHHSPVRIPDDVNTEDGDQNVFIIPDILFNPAIDRYPLKPISESNSNEYCIKIKDQNSQLNKPSNFESDVLRINNKPYKGRVDVKAYPFYIDPRIDLVFNKRESQSEIKSEDIKMIYNNHTAEDFFVSFVTILCETIQKGEIYDETKIEEFVRSLTTKSKIKEHFERVDILNFLNNPKTKSLTVRDWFSANQELYKSIREYHDSILKDYTVEYKIPDVFMYQTWYLGVPQASPRKDCACEIIVKMTEPHDLEMLKITGLGIPLAQGAFAKYEQKFLPMLDYNKFLKRLEMKVEKNVNKVNKKQAIPISHMLCYYDLITAIGGSLKNLFERETYKNLFERETYVQSNDLEEGPKASNTQSNDLKEGLKAIIGNLLKKIANNKNRCEHCLHKQDCKLRLLKLKKEDTGKPAT